MHFSALLILTRPEQIPECIRQLEALPGVEVHYSYSDSGKIITVLESSSLEGQKDMLRRIQGLETVLIAELVYHYHESETGEPEKVERPKGRARDKSESDET
jgi:nitrate reductase NapD